LDYEIAINHAAKRGSLPSRSMNAYIFIVLIIGDDIKSLWSDNPEAKGIKRPFQDFYQAISIITNLP
jgi:hypothetical protein